MLHISSPIQRWVTKSSRRGAGWHGSAHFARPAQVPRGKSMSCIVCEVLSFIHCPAPSCTQSSAFGPPKVSDGTAIRSPVHVCRIQAVSQRGLREEAAPGSRREVPRLAKPALENGGSSRRFHGLAGRRKTRGSSRRLPVNVALREDGETSAWTALGG